MYPGVEPASSFIPEWNPDHSRRFTFGVVNACMRIAGVSPIRAVEIRNRHLRLVRRAGSAATWTWSVRTAVVPVAFLFMPISVFAFQAGIGIDYLVIVVDNVNPAACKGQYRVNALLLHADLS